MAGQQMANFDWSVISALLDPSSSISGDVKFQVMDQKGQVVDIMEAHKIILALHSDHFKNAFFGSGVFFKENEEGIVVIKDTTKEAFEDFVGFNYEKRIEFEKKTLPELYEVLNLAERYQVRELKNKVVNLIKNFPVSINNVTKVAAATFHFPEFKEESGALGSINFSSMTYRRLKTKTKTAPSMRMMAATGPRDTQLSKQKLR